MKEKISKKGITRRLFRVVLAFVLGLSLIPTYGVTVYAALNTAATCTEHPNSCHYYITAVPAGDDYTAISYDLEGGVYSGEYIPKGAVVDGEASVGTWIYVGSGGPMYHCNGHGGSGPDTSSWPTAVHTEGCGHSGAMHFYATGNTFEMSSDTLVEGRHFISGMTYDYYAGSPNASDAYSINTFLNGTCAEGWYWYDTASHCFKPCVEPTHTPKSQPKTGVMDTLPMWFGVMAVSAAAYVLTSKKRFF